jgi:hypothetical protein
MCVGELPRISFVLEALAVRCCSSETFAGAECLRFRSGSEGNARVTALRMPSLDGSALCDPLFQLVQRIPQAMEPPPAFTLCEVLVTQFFINTHSASFLRSGERE